MAKQKCEKCNGAGKYTNLIFTETCEDCGGVGVIENFEEDEASEFSFVRAERDELLEENNSLQCALIDLQQELSTKDQKIKQLSEDLGDADDALDDLVEENKNLRTEIDKLKKAASSKTQKYSDPLKRQFHIPVPPQWQKCSP